MNITDAITYIGVDDPNLELFENQYMLERGMAYNSYLVSDDKIAVMDTVDFSKKDEWLGNLETALGNKKPDYLVVQHMEPDHSGSIEEFLKKYPGTTIVCSDKAKTFMGQFFKSLHTDEFHIVKNCDTLSLGSRELTFITAPMVHWPEVILTYDSKDKVLFSADAFGKFGIREADEEWDCEARRYYFNICGKYGAQVQNVLKAAAKLDIEIIAPLHGPILTQNLNHYIDLYDTWSSYKAEDKGVYIACASIHGHTYEAALKLKEILESKGEKIVELANLGSEDIAEAVEDGFRYDRIVLMCCTYDGGIFLPMADYLTHLGAKGFQNRTAAIVENGTWAPTAGRQIRERLEGMKNITVLDQMVTIRSAMTDANIKELEELADALIKA